MGGGGAAQDHQHKRDPRAWAKADSCTRRGLLRGTSGKIGFIRGKASSRVVGPQKTL